MNGSSGPVGAFGTTLSKLALLGALAFLPSCGGGGGGGVDVTPPSTNLRYVLGPPRAGVAPLTVEAGESKFTLSSNPPAIELPSIRGTYDTATLDATIDDNAVLPILWADTATPTDNPLFGNLEVVASKPFRWNDANDPTSGEFLITSRDGFFPGKIRAGVSTAGGAGVRTGYDSANDGIYEQEASETWGSFYGLWEDDTKPLFQRVASFVFYTREAIFSVMELSMETVNTIEDHRAELQAAGSDNAIQVDCDALPGAPNQPGSFSIAWTDVNGNGVIDHDLSGAGKHDTFTFMIGQCWIDDPTDPEDLLLDGVIRIAYYEPSVQWGPVFENLVITLTRNNKVVYASPVTVNGGFSLLIPGY